MRIGTNMQVSRSPNSATNCFAPVFFLVLVAVANGQSPAPQAAGIQPSAQAILQPLVSEYCVRCHGADEQNADRRFDQLAATIDSDNTLVDYQDILDQINLGAMPPEDEPQPTDDERRAVVDWLTATLADFHAEHAVQFEQPLLRRLNAREYRNTIRDLLHINMTMFDPTEFFPRDRTSENLDNVASALVTSGYLLERYLESADLVVEKVLRLRDKPEVQVWKFVDGFHQQPEIDQVHRKTNGYSHLTLYDVVGADKHEGAYAPIHAFASGVPHDGYYEIRFLAEALNRFHPYDDEFLGTDRSEPLKLGIVAGNQLAGPLHKPQPMEPLLAEIDLADEKKWYTVRIWLDQGFTPRFTFRNGLMDARELWSKILKRYPDQFPNPNVSGIVDRRFNAIKYGKLPQIQIDEVEIEGPYFDTWPTQSQRGMLGEAAAEILNSGRFPSEEAMREQVVAVASKAYGYPVEANEVQRVLETIAQRRSMGRDELQAFGDGIKVILSSPNFIYMPHSQELPEYALAARLAYFLWSSKPDAELLQAARAGILSDRTVLRQQAQRMLADARSDALVGGLLDSWLNLRELGASPPDRSKFEAFYHYDLGTAMRRETELFTRYLLDENLSAQLFLDSDFTFVNRRLAKHYGLELPSENEFQKVALPDDRRGGLLGQASVLTVSANGIDTSPVVRGVWLLENLLGTPPAPPPPDVEPLDPDTRGATTIREQLSKHRESASCNDCHRKIDPPGFALENFDAIGAWREKYDGKAPIDASGALAGGREFEDIRGLKKLLVEDKSVFYQALVSKLLAYACGRHMGPADRPHIDRLVKRLSDDEIGFRDLVIEVACSVPFVGAQESPLSVAAADSRDP